MFGAFFRKITGKNRRPAQETKTEPKYSLNGAQKNIIEGTLHFIFDELNEISSAKAIKALEAIVSENISDNEVTAFKQQSLWLECIEPIRTITNHANPENRADTYPYVEEQKVGFSMYKIGRERIKFFNSSGDAVLLNGRIISKTNIVRKYATDFIIAKEPQGLLGLTSREDNDTPPVNKEVVVEYIKQLVAQEIFKHKARPVINDDVNISQNADISFEFPEKSECIDIRFRMFPDKADIQGKLELLLSKCRRFQGPDYYSGPEKIKINAHDATPFFDVLLSIKYEFGPRFILGKIEFNKLIDDLYTGFRLTSKEKKYYLDNMPTELTLEEREKLAEEKQDYNEAIELAKIYQLGKSKPYINSEKALFWLRKAIKLKPPGVNLEQSINVDNFFLSFTSLSCPHIFAEGQEILLSA